MKIIVIYASIEGQTKKIADHLTENLRGLGHEVSSFNAMDRTADLSMDPFDRVILAGSVHERMHPKPFEIFLSGNADVLSQKPTMLLSISMSAAFSEGIEEAEEYVEELVMRTGVKPSVSHCVGGAIKLGKYDYYALQVVRHVVLRDRDFDPDQNDHEFTDWDDLDAKVAAFVGA